MENLRSNPSLCGKFLDLVTGPSMSVEQKMNSSLDNISEQSLRRKRKMYETLPGYSPKFHLDGIHALHPCSSEEFRTDCSNDMINNCNGIITLFYWELLTNKYGKQYAVGYLPNGHSWKTSEIERVAFSYDEYNLEHFRIETYSGTIYKLPLRCPIFDENCISIDHRHKYSKEDSVKNGIRVIDITDWKIVNKSWRGGKHRVYYLRGISPNGGYDIFTTKITNIVLHNKGSRPVLYFISKNGYKYRASINESRYINEFVHV